MVELNYLNTQRLPQKLIKNCNICRQRACIRVMRKTMKIIVYYLVDSEVAVARWVNSAIKRINPYSANRIYTKSRKWITLIRYITLSSLRTTGPWELNCTAHALYLSIIFFKPFVFTHNEH